MYCLYDYYKEPWNEELEDLSKNLSEKERKAVKEKLKICHEESLKGNGDDPEKEPQSVKKKS